MQGERVMNRLPVWKTTMDSCRLVLGQPLTFLRLAFPTLVILFVFQALGMWLLADVWDALLVEMERAVATGMLSPSQAEALAMGIQGPGALMVLVQFLGQIVFLLLTVLVVTAWLRFVVLGDRGNGRWLVPRVGAPEIEMIAGVIIFGLGLSVAGFMALALSLAAVAAVGMGGQLVMAVLFTALFLAVCRFTLYLPQVASGGGLDPLAAWRLGRGNTLRLFTIYGLIGLPWLLVAMVLQAVTLVVILAYIGFFSAPGQATDQMMALMRDIVQPWRAGPAFFFCWLLMMALWAGVMGLGMALQCAALGLCYAGLRPGTPGNGAPGEAARTEVPTSEEPRKNQLLPTVRRPE